MRKAIAAVAVLAMMVLAGCSGGDGPRSDSAGPGGSNAGGNTQAGASSQGATAATKAPATESTKGAGKAGSAASADASASSGKGQSQASAQASASGGKGGTKAGSQTSAGAKAKTSTGSKATGKAPGTSAGGSNGSGSIGATAGSGDSDTAAAPALTLLEDAEATERYREIDDGYTASLRSLLKALAKRPLSMKAVRSGVKKSTVGYRERTEALQAIPWPKSVQPKVDTFVELASTTGLAMFKEMESAQTTADLGGRANQPDVRKLTNAERAMRSALGLPNPTAG